MSRVSRAALTAGSDKLSSVYSRVLRSGCSGIRCPGVSHQQIVLGSNGSLASGNFCCEGYSSLGSRASSHLLTVGTTALGRFGWTAGKGAGGPQDMQELLGECALSGSSITVVISSWMLVQFATI